jgi:4-amino-4-deoxy-L-arabinose transferase-like glycosyltransferase
LKPVLQKYFLEIILSIGIVFALFYKLGYMPLSADEPIRALVAIDMMLNGNYVAPKMNGVHYVNKPPLYNWILIVLFNLFKSFDEWVLRLPSLLSLIAFGGVLFHIVKRHLEDVRFAWIAAVAGITGGNLWIYSAYLGHIDITYSVISFLQIYVLYYFSSIDNWRKAFVFSYGLACIGFMMKGLPTVVFQGLSLVTILVIKRDLKRIWSLEHIVSTLIFLIPIGIYVYAYSKQADITKLAKTIVVESSSRTVTDKRILESVGHLFVFPIRYLLDIMPWGLSVFVLLRKDARTLIWKNSFLKSSLLLFLVNIIIYWLSPDYRARYVFMLTPLLLIPCLYAVYELIKSKATRQIALAVSFLLILLPLGLFYFTHNTMDVSPVFGIALCILGLVGIGLIHKNVAKPAVYLLVLGLIISRLGYSQYMVPFRVETGPYQQEKIQGKEIAAITMGEGLDMYSSNVALTMNWYMTVDRQETVHTKTKDFSFESYYLVPTEVIKDTANVDTYYTFVRRYESKPFSLVKFKHRFPEMPKKKK